MSSYLFYCAALLALFSVVHEPESAPTDRPFSSNMLQAADSPARPFDSAPVIARAVDEAIEPSSSEKNRSLRMN